jgi:hypothetical protein
MPIWADKSAPTADLPRVWHIPINLLKSIIGDGRDKSVPTAIAGLIY